MGISIITKGILEKTAAIETARIYCPINININKQKPTITIRPIKKQINLDVKYPKE